MESRASSDPWSAGSRRTRVTTTGTALSPQAIRRPLTPPSSVSTRYTRARSVTVPAFMPGSRSESPSLQDMTTSNASQSQRSASSRLGTVEDQERPVEGDVVGRAVVFALHEPPVGGVEFGKIDISREIFLDQRELKPVGDRQALAVDLGAAGDEHLVVTAAQRERLFDGTGHEHAFRRIALLARDDHHAPPGQGPAADRVEGLATHDQDVAHGELLEAPEIGRQPPGHPVVPADDP